MNKQLILLLSSVILLSHIAMSSGQGAWNGGNVHTNTWSSASSNGQPGQSDFSSGYAGVDANGVPYGSSTGNGGFRINVSDGQGRQQTYSGGQGGYPGQPGQPGYPGYPGPHSYDPNNPNYNYGSGGYRSGSSSAWSSAWSTFYVVALYSLFLMLKS